MRSAGKAAPLLEVKHLKKYFMTSSGPLHAVDDVSFTIEAGKTLGIVGESGCGKSTLGRVILGLLEATDGEVIYSGENITNANKRRWKELRKEMQIIFQDPMSSLNPRFTVTECIAESLRIFNVCKDKKELNRRVFELMRTVGLDERLAASYPHELDGGRRQRVGIARALCLSPKFIVCDEPVSSLDVSIQAQILNLLQDLQKENDLTYIFITHDMFVVRHISDDILVIHLGCIMEKCSSDELFERQLHPYTKGLLAAIPVPDIDVPRIEVMLEGELTSPINPKPGCRFANRCIYAQERCFVEFPVLEEVFPDHYVSCHFCREINKLVWK